MKKNLIKIILSGALVICMIILLSGCGDNNEAIIPQTMNNTEEMITQTMNNYFAAKKSHDVKEINKYLSSKNQIDPNDEDYINALVNTVVDCKLLSIDFDNMQQISENRYRVRVDFEITYSEDYIPVGTWNVGVNNVAQIYDLKEKDGKFIIVKIEHCYV